MRTMYFYVFGTCLGPASALLNDYYTNKWLPLVCSWISDFFTTVWHPECCNITHKLPISKDSIMSKKSYMGFCDPNSVKQKYNIFLWSTEVIVQLEWQMDCQKCCNRFCVWHCRYTSVGMVLAYGTVFLPNLWVTPVPPDGASWQWVGIIASQVWVAPVPTLIHSNTTYGTGTTEF